MQQQIAVQFPVICVLLATANHMTRPMVSAARKAAGIVRNVAIAEVAVTIVATIPNTINALTCAALDGEVTAPGIMAHCICAQKESSRR